MPELLQTKLNSPFYSCEEISLCWKTLDAQNVSCHCTTPCSLFTDLNWWGSSRSSLYSNVSFIHCPPEYYLFLISLSQQLKCALTCIYTCFTMKRNWIEHRCFKQHSIRPYICELPFCYHFYHTIDQPASFLI